MKSFLKSIEFSLCLVKVLPFLSYALILYCDFCQIDITGNLTGAWIPGLVHIMLGVITHQNTVLFNHQPWIAAVAYQ